MRRIFGDAEFFRGLAAVGLPVALQNLLTNSLTLVDSLMIGRLGESAVAAVGVAGQFSHLMFGFYWGIGRGGTTFFAQYFGARRRAGNTPRIWTDAGTGAGGGIMFGLAAVCAPELVMRMYTDVTEVQVLGVKYIRIVGLSYIMTTFSMALSCLMRSIEQVRLPLIASVASLCVNTLLNYVLIFGHMGSRRRWAWRARR